jgi:hypothetical protein
MWYSNLKKKFLFLDISSTNTDTLVSSLYQCVKTHSIEVFWLLSQPLPFQPLRHQRNLCHVSWPSCEPLCATNIPTASRKRFIMNILCIESFWPQETCNRMLPFGSTLLKNSRHFDYWNQPLNIRMRVCYRDCHEVRLCCYLVIHRKPMTSITDVLLLFVAYLLTLPRRMGGEIRGTCIARFREMIKVTKLERNRPLRRGMDRWEDNIKVDLGAGVQAVVNMVCCSFHILKSTI